MARYDDLTNEQEKLLRQATDAYGPGRQALVRSILHLTNTNEHSSKRIFWLTIAIAVMTAALVALTTVLIVTAS